MINSILRFFNSFLQDPNFVGLGQCYSISILTASLLLGAAGYHGDGELDVGAGHVAPLNVVASGVIVKLKVSVINVFTLAFGGLAGSVAPVALAFTLTADTRVAFELSSVCSKVERAAASALAVAGHIPARFPVALRETTEDRVPTSDGLLDLVRVRHCQWFPCLF